MSSIQLNESIVSDDKSFTFLFKYLKPFKNLLLQVLFGFFFCSLVSIAFPFLTQSLIDIGVNHRNVDFVYSILFAQLILFISQSSVEYLRSWLLLHLGARINITLISDFLKKLMRLPIPYFEKNMLGNLLQRINDHSRIQNFLTNSTLSFFFSFMNFLIFSFILIIYSLKIFLIFIIGSLIGVLWVLMFMKKRRDLDSKRFFIFSDNQNKLVQIISGIQDIKLNNCDNKKRNEWENVQIEIFRLNTNALIIGQLQQGGAIFFNNLKNILITIMSAQEVINGNMTLGMMLAVSYIMGQLNAPIEQFLGFVQSAQDAKLSLNRISEVHKLITEGDNCKNHFYEIKNKRSIVFNNVSFKYDNNNKDYTLKNVNIEFLEGKTTALIGKSGSGKSTLLKLLLRFYYPTKGEILIDNLQLNELNIRFWRAKCGAVLQDGYIFNDTIESNIILSENNVNRKQLEKAIEISNVNEFLKELPNGLKSIVGVNGHGISQGQKQRLLLARAIYKNPDYLFLDEATSNLDSSNENLIMQNLINEFSEKTIVIIAHKLSTLKNANQIIVLDKGHVKEMGSHDCLLESNGIYKHLFSKSI